MSVTMSSSKAKDPTRAARRAARQAQLQIQQRALNARRDDNDGGGKPAPDAEASFHRSHNSHGLDGRIDRSTSRVCLFVC
jgi:hypothetical protein